MKLPLRTREVASTLALLLFTVVATPNATAQNRDFNTERLLLDDDGDGGVRNTLLLEAPSLSANRVLTFPDAGGTVMTGAAPLTAGQILFGGVSGQTEQSASLFWDNGAGIFNIGGNFTVDAAAGNTGIAGTLAVTGATSLSSLSLTGKATSASTVDADPGTTLVTKDYLVAGNLAVSTDATLNGDGTTGSLLGIDLTNPNSWTGAQTFGSVDINGGTIDGVTIGATTPAAGTFGTLDANSVATFDADVTIGDSPTDAVFMNGTLAGATPLSFEGASSDVNELTFAVTDPTAARTITFPDASGTVALTSDLTVSTDATLTGDGEGTPLGINLANANTWTGTQTLPTTAAQGDALIASTNVGTATIDAARIGAGLTDAQVNDNLTINGGSVDATPIGATTPSTGVFTTIAGTALPSGSAGTDVVISSAGALETRTIASLGGSIAVSTDATLSGDGTTATPLGIDLTNANIWTGTQTLPTTAAQGDALIASTNAGTTTINAARIGAGLTDAQVDNNLTIDGGTVDATPVGAAAQSTGAFTTLSASGATTLAGALDAQAAANTIGSGADAVQLTVDGTIGGATDLQVNGDLDVTGTLTTNGFSSGVSGFTLSGDLDVNGNDIVDGTDGDVTVIDDLVVTGNVNPGASLTYTLGTDALRWNDAYIGPASLHVGPTGGEGATTEMVLGYAVGTNEGTLSVDGGVVLAMTTAATDFSTTLNVDGDLTVGTTNFTVDAATGNTTVAGTLSATGIVSGNGSGLTNLDATDLTGDVPTATLTTNVVAAVNGSAGLIDAVRIGNGLTDAQVSDDLTLGAGSTIEATPVGATTPSTGGFTTLAASGTITGGSSLTLGDDATPAPGQVVLNDNTAANGFEGTIQTVAGLTVDRVYTLPDADGTIALVGEIPVSTDATLSGDGTSGDALGIDLTHANNWTGAQTFSSVDINGGSIDGTPIGGTVRSTGAFSTAVIGSTVTVGQSGVTVGSVIIHDGNGQTGTIRPAVDALTANRTYILPDADGTIALTTDLTVTTDATLTGDGEGTPLGIDLANANSWTGAQTFSSVAISGGTIDGTSIGATTPSTGAFTTVSTTGALTINDGAGTDLVIAEGGLDRSSGAAEAIQLDNSGAGAADVLINGATQTTNSRLTVNEGHWTSEQATAPTGAGTVDFAAGAGGSVTVTGTDVAGSVNAVSGGTTGSSTFTVTFNQAYATAPIVVVTPANAAAYNNGFYLSATNTTSFTVTVFTAATGSNLFTYHVIETAL